MSLVLCCRDATELLTEESEGALTGGAKAKMAVHMTICARCRAYRRQLGTTVDILRAMPRPREEANADDIDAILRRLAGEVS